MDARAAIAQSQRELATLRKALSKAESELDELRHAVEKQQRKNAGLVEEVGGLQRSRDKWKARAEAAESVAADARVEQLQELAKQAVMEARIFGVPGAVPAIPVTAFAELIMNEP